MSQNIISLNLNVCVFLFIMQSNLEIFIPGGEKHRVCGILPLTCFAMGCESKRLHTCCIEAMKSCGPVHQTALKLYMKSGGEMAGWEHSMDWESMIADGFEPEACLKQLRKEVRHSNTDLRYFFV